MNLNKKISNVDTLSALFDRLITERIKHYFFVKHGDAAKVAHQHDIILELKTRIADTFDDCFEEYEYLVVNEHRTFDLRDIVDEVDMLTVNDILVGENDRFALEGFKENCLDKLSIGVSGFRKANERRAQSKTLIDKLFEKIFRK